MINPAKIEEIAKQISSNMPQGVKNLADTFESKTKQVIQNKLAEMDFVSREEFDIQSKVLMRTREKLAELEAKVAEIEAKLNSDKHAEAKAILAGLRAKIDLGRSQAKDKIEDEEDYGSFGGSS